MRKSTVVLANVVVFGLVFGHDMLNFVFKCMDWVFTHATAMH